MDNPHSALTLAPDWQGRVMTNTAEGDNGFSFGWVNRVSLKVLGVSLEEIGNVF